MSVVGQENQCLVDQMNLAEVTQSFYAILIRPPTSEFPDLVSAKSVTTGARDGSSEGLGLYEVQTDAR